MEINLKDEKYRQAKNAMMNAYAPYSKFSVGAVVVLQDGMMITGSNVENASYGLTNCAERSALFAAYSQGYRKDDIVEIIIMTKTKTPTSPCGACRQVIIELMNQETLVRLVNNEGYELTMKVNELLPRCFSEDNLNE